MITSFSNPKVRYIQNLKERRFREKERRIFVEGFRELNRAIDSSQRKTAARKSGIQGLDSLLPEFRVEVLCISPDCFLGENEWELIQKFQTPVWEFPRGIFEKLSIRDRPDGLIAIAELPDIRYNFSFLSVLQNCKSPVFGINHLILVIEGVEKPGNLGTILRTAEGAGVSLVIVTDPKIDVFSPNTIRSSTGILFHIPIAVGDTLAVMKDLSRFGYKRYALTPEASQVYFQEDLTGKLALIFGSEQYGLSDIAKSESDKNIYIPMHGVADSLNLAQSCGIVIYESLRQRMDLERKSTSNSKGE